MILSIPYPIRIQIFLTNRIANYDGTKNFVEILIGSVDNLIQY